VSRRSGFILTFLFSLFISFPAWSQSASDKWSLLGAELGSFNRTAGSSVNSKGEIVWTNSNRQWEDFGWDLRDADLSDYEGIKIVLKKNSPKIPIDALKLDNGYSHGHWLFRETLPGVYILYFDGRGKDCVWGYVDEMDPASGMLIYFTVPGKKENLRTKIESVELLKKGSSESQEELSPFNVTLGTTNIRAFVEGDRIFWRRGYNDSSSGWDFTGIDLSEYDRVRVEVAEPDANLNLILCDGKWKNWHCFGRVSPRVFEAKLSGEDARWFDTDAHSFDLKEGLMVMLQKQDEKIRTEETVTRVTGIRFLKSDEEIKNGEKFRIENRGLGAILDNAVLDGETIIWQKENNDLKCGWNLAGLDLSEYKGVRVEFEKNEIRLELTITDKNWQNWTAFRGEDPYKIEAYFSKEGAAWQWNETEHYDLSQGILLFLRFYSDKPLKKDRKTIIKSIEFIK